VLRRPFESALYTLLRNPIYVGEIRHNGARYPCQHQHIVERSVWDKAQELLPVHTVRKESKVGESSPSPLIGKLFDEAGEGLQVIVGCHQNCIS
jgi:site-specific DNA recombinase